jgi:flagellar protein FliS
MVASHAYANKYKEVAIKTATPLQLVVILYDGAIQALQEAQEHIRKQDIPGRARCINRSVAIISELQASLNFSVGGDIAGSLDRLYNYMKQRIFKANVDQSVEPLSEVVVLLGNLRSAWNAVASQASMPESAPAKMGTGQRIFDATAPAPALSSSFNISG